MSSSAQFLNASEAASRLGVSAKALRLYEQRGLIAPIRTAAGWRAYGPDEMAAPARSRPCARSASASPRWRGCWRATPSGLEPALAAHQAVTRRPDAPARRRRSRRSGSLRDDLARGKAPTAGELARLTGSQAPNSASPSTFPGPGAASGSSCDDVRPLNYIIGPLGSGKTRLAQRLAETLPDAAFLGLDRLADGGAAARARWTPIRLSSRGSIRRWPGSSRTAPRCRRPWSPCSPALESEGPAILVVDMMEQGLDQATQEAADRPSAPPWARRPAALPAHALQRDPGLGRPSAPTRRSSSAPPITARRPASPPIPARPATRPSPPVWPRPRCGRGRKASSRGGRKVASGRSTKQ